MTKEYISQPYHYVLDTFIHWRKNGELILRPPYQRAYCWTHKQQINLIDSIYRKLPLPAFFIRRNGKFIEVIDEHQRLQTIFNFLDGVLKIDGREPVHGGLPFTYAFLTYEVHRLNDAETIDLYNRLNFNGTPHKESERA